MGVSSEGINSQNQMEIRHRNNAHIFYMYICTLENAYTFILIVYSQR